ncbi:MAG: TIGR03560 family F420-dependent LLM class oxidoreductase [Gammaproteobacteria bacterium]|jgi:F420-dependent oxidoreductase-like protein|nr:TIGR03560 family F420-dependent LLM class oxidoreductase [Gammaproteobacteria bacterium]MBT7369972.1 TIGR03560 family F420-dependent LLM class oxidoreductase [Gammaproteobacteria bacterium]
MRFSFWPTPMLPFEETLSLGKHIAATGWDGLWLADHFMPNAEDTSSPWPEAWTTLAALAPQVPNVRLGTMVTGNTYRHPAVLAKMAATLDHISDGRLILGLGSGWQENEHQQYGIEFSTVRGRLERLEEACQVIKKLFTEKQANFAGSYYTLDNASLEPKPKQDRLPLLIGGGGEKVTLRITATYADEWNVWGTVETLISKMAILDQHCETIGRSPDEIQRSAVALLFLSDDDAFLSKIRESSDRPIIAGNVNEVRDTVAAYREAGVDELIIPDFTLGKGQQKIDQLDTFINDVAPVARD